MESSPALAAGVIHRFYASSPAHAITGCRGLKRRQALPKNHGFFGFGLLHLTPARFGLQSVPCLPFCFAAFSVACPPSFWALTEPESCATAAGTKKAEASRAVQKNLLIRVPFHSTDSDFSFGIFYQMTVRSVVLRPTPSLRLLRRTGARLTHNF